MKKSTFFLISVLLYTVTSAQNVGIGTTTPAASAQLDVNSTSKGFLPPRMTFDQRNAIVNPVAGLVVYCTDCDELQIFNGLIWKSIIYGTVASPPSGYPTVIICNQVWMNKNLVVSNYRNGDPIPQVTDPAVWAGLTTGAWCWYENDSATYSSYGKLYNWYAVNDPRGLAPLGWHIPTDAEWTTFITCLGGDIEAGGAMKEAGTLHWISPNTGATNSSGFAAWAGGARGITGVFGNLGDAGSWWSSSEEFGEALHRIIFYNGTYVHTQSSSKEIGYSVRCFRD